MRYRNAHWWLAALLPLIVLAFWPGYFSQLQTSTLARHVHGVTGTLWIALTAFQSWSIAARRFAWHRAAGRAVFVVAPAFVGGGVLAVLALASSYAAGSDPFNAAFGARLAPLDLATAVAMALLVREALARRRRVGRHAAAMLATVLLVLPPVLGRLYQHIPGLPVGFVPSFYAGEMVAAAMATWLWWRDRRDGRAFLVVALLGAAQCASFALLPGDGFARALATMPAIPVALAAAAATLALLWHAWRPVPVVARAAAAG